MTDLNIRHLDDILNIMNAVIIIIKSRLAQMVEQPSIKLEAAGSNLGKSCLFIIIILKYCKVDY